MMVLDIVGVIDFVEVQDLVKVLLWSRLKACFPSGASSFGVLEVQEFVKVLDLIEV